MIFVNSKGPLSMYELFPNALSHLKMSSFIQLQASQNPLRLIYTHSSIQISTRSHKRVPMLTWTAFAFV